MSRHSTPSQTMIKATNLQLSRGGRRLLDDVTARIDAGSLTLVLGHNGAGKSLFLAIIFEMRWGMTAHCYRRPGEMPTDRRLGVACSSRERQEFFAA